MRVKGATLQQFLLGVALLLALCWNLAHASEIKSLALSEGPTGTRAEVMLDTTAGFTTLSLSGPDRLVVDLPATRLGKGVALPAATGVIKSVRTGQPVPGTVRVVFDLAAPIAALKPHMEPTAGGARLVLEWPGDGKASDAAPEVTATAAVTPAPLSSTVPARADAGLSPAQILQGAATSAHAGDGDTQSISATPSAVATQALPPAAGDASISPPPQGATKTMQQIMRGGMRPLIVAIDAGHGGQDPGARGGKGIRE